MNLCPVPVLLSKFWFWDPVQSQDTSENLSDGGHGSNGQGAEGLSTPESWGEY